MDKEHVYKLMKEVALDCIASYKTNRKSIDADSFVNAYESYPLLRYANTGYPYFIKSNSYKINYTSVLIKNQKLSNTTSIISYLEYVLNDEEYCRFFCFGKFGIFEGNSTTEVTEKMYTKIFLFNVIDRYFQLHSKLKLQEIPFREICFEWLNYITNKTLEFNLVIPILMNTFNFKTSKLSDEVEIFKMNEKFQKSRNNFISENSSANQRVVSCATHAFRIRRNTYQQEDSNSVNLLQQNKRLKELTDLIFGYLRIATSCVTGYAQLIIEPVEWAKSWTADLSPLIINTTRAYPTIFEESEYWYNQPQELSNKQLSRLNFKAYLKIVENNRAIKIAIQRLNSVYLREGDADIILDIAIGLEAIYLEAKNDEGITHKLASRSALLCKKYPLDDLTSEDVFIATKKMYAYRSAIIHSKDEKKIEKTKLINLTNNKSIKAGHYGISLLRHSIYTMILHPEFSNPTRIDELMYR